MVPADGRHRAQPFRVRRWLGGRWKRTDDWSAAREARIEREVVRKVETVKQSKREPIKIEPVLAPIEKSERAQRETQIPLFAGASREGELPPLSLLDEPKPQVKGYSEETLEALSRQVEFKLKDFRIDAQVVSAHPGPVITRFEMQPAPGIKGSQISSLDKDIARGLSVVSVRVVDVIPGQIGHRSRDPELAPRDRLSLGNPELGQIRRAEIAAVARARQGHRRRAGRGRSAEDAASARRRHDGLGQIGRAQRDGAEPSLQGERRATCA